MIDPNYFGYAGFRFSWGDHICAIFDLPGQQEEIMGGFMAQGLAASQRCVWVASPFSAERFRRMMRAIEADLPTLEASGQLLVVSDVEFYLKKGLFEPDRTMDLLRALLEDGQRQGYETMRMATDMSWLMSGRADLEVWEEYEGRLTQEVAGLPVVMVCQYDRRQVSGSIVVAAFRTHPIVVLGDTIHENPFYAAREAGAAAPEVV